MVLFGGGGMVVPCHAHYGCMAVCLMGSARLLGTTGLQDCAQTLKCRAFYLLQGPRYLYLQHRLDAGQCTQCCLPDSLLGL
jgi:hypothetical protein